MSRLILADNNNGNAMPTIEDYYVRVPTKQGILLTRNDVFLNELCCLSEGEIKNVMYGVVQENPKLGVVEDVIAIAVDTIEILKDITDGIKDTNLFKGQPPAVVGYQYPGKEKTLADIKAGILSYKDGALLWGPNNPFVKKTAIYQQPAPGTPPVPVGTFYANAPDEIIQALDPKYLNALSNIANVPTTTTTTKPGGSILQNLLPNMQGGKGITVNTKPGGGISISTGEEWYKNPLVYIAGAGVLFGLYKMLKR